MKSRIVLLLGLALLLASLGGTAGATSSTGLPGSESTKRTGTTGPKAPQSVASLVSSGTATQWANSVGLTSELVSASFGTSDPIGLGISNAPLGNQFPTEGGSFGLLSSGTAANATLPNSSGSLSTTLAGLNNSQGKDMTQVTLNLHSPAYATCLAFDFAFLSEEFPEYVGSSFNDTFTAEIGASTMTITGNTVNAPNNFAFDVSGDIISVNTVFGVTSGTNTTYDGATPLLRARTAVSPDVDVNVILSVQDLGDNIFDSTAFIDKFFWSADSSCADGSQADTDNDGLLDDWEQNGITVDGEFVDLPAMGANKLKKDIFIEADYMVDPGTCGAYGCAGGHTHKPKDDAMAAIRNSFANAPVANPAPSTNGINLHVDYGPGSVMNPVTGATWGALSKGGALTHDSSLGASVGGDYSWTEFQTIKNTKFSDARKAFFHYVIFAHNMGGFGSTSGISRNGTASDGEFANGASDFIVSLGGWTDQVGTVNEQAGTFMHELGHNIGLRHGGDDHRNRKPNFLSVMNYDFQTRGLIISGVEGNFDYSRFDLVDLNEASLNETIGITGSPLLVNYGTRYWCSAGSSRTDTSLAAIDWNCDVDSVDNPLSRNINAGPTGADTTLNVLTSHNDWANIVFTGGAVGAPGAVVSYPASSDVIDTTKKQDAVIKSINGVAISGPDSLSIARGATKLLKFKVKNTGSVKDTFTLTATRTANIIKTGSVPSSVTLSAGKSKVIGVKVSVPNKSSVKKATLTLKAQSNKGATITDTAVTTVNVVRKKTPTKVTLAKVKQKITKGAKWTAKGTLRDRLKAGLIGETVYVQIKKGSKWVTVEKGTTNTAGAYKIKVKINKNSNYRTAFKAGGALKASKSATIKVKIK